MNRVNCVIREIRRVDYNFILFKKYEKEFGNYGWLDIEMQKEESLFE